ncbi:MAG: aldo/keto reductase [Desulfobacterium sp.]|nr:aldo/keto reductase [Desulfobacterium sp.]MBU4036667.1 aldo/keto reductase [Pseudomonadota bacterium]
MLYRSVKKNGDRLSVLGFGAMRLAQKNGKIDEERATNQIRHVIDSGVNYVDTAWPYHGGESESFLGRALAEGYRDKVKLATKLPSWIIKSREDMDRYLDAQMTKLNTDRIDYYLLHGLNGHFWDSLNALNVLDFLNKAKKDGRILNAGFSFHGILDDFKRIVDAYPWEFCQIQYNYLDENNQAGKQGLKYAAAKELGIIIMEPLRGGNLGRPNPPPAIAAIWKEAKQPRTPAEWALRWVWNHPEVTVVLSGMNEESHIEENLAIADKALPNSLTKDELDLIDRAAHTYVDIMKINCTGCGYCLPCPSDVSIPICFETYNDLHMFGNADEAPFIYAVRNCGIATGQPGYASQCVQCDECLEKCPQQINIPEFLEKVVQEIEGDNLKQFDTLAKQLFMGSLSQE